MPRYGGGHPHFLQTRLHSPHLPLTAKPRRTISLKRILQVHDKLDLFPHGYRLIRLKKPFLVLSNSLQPANPALSQQKADYVLLTFVKLYNETHSYLHRFMGIFFYIFRYRLGLSRTKEKWTFMITGKDDAIDWREL
jgi:hypothetical protein